MHLTHGGDALVAAIDVAAVVHSPRITVNYIDISPSGYVAGYAVNQALTLFLQTILAAPAAGVMRKITYITIYNADSAPSNVDIALYDGTVSNYITTKTVASNGVRSWTEATGWQDQ